jgi:hypothetical protein
MGARNLKRLAAAGMAALLTVALAACFVLPGKFAETLDIRKDGRFSYAYKGEIMVMGLTKMAAMANAADNTFKPGECFDDESGDTRECSKDEIAQQKADWEADRKTNEGSRKERDEAMMAMLGGIDPSDPRAGEELAERLRKQAGWRSVVYKGDGLYEVDFAISARLDHDFSFPTVERMPMLVPFLTINRRADGTVRITSPILENNGAQGAGMGGLAAIGGTMSKDEQASFPKLDGTLTLTTDAEILANNTEEGPKADPAGKRLVWKMNIQNPAAPMALLQLAR